MLQGACGQNPARQTAIFAGVPESVPSYTINKVCGSGLKAVQLGMHALLCGDASVVACGGQECMSQAPHAIPGKTSRLGAKMGNMVAVDTMVR